MPLLGGGERIWSRRAWGIGGMRAAVDTALGGPVGSGTMER